MFRAGQPNLSALGGVHLGVVPQQLELRYLLAPLTRALCVLGLRILRELTQKIHDSQILSRTVRAPRGGDSGTSVKEEP